MQKLEADLVVAGFGAGGAAAAIAGAELGASVLILEKQPAHAHTPSIRMSGGAIMAVTDVDNGAVYLDRCAGGLVPWSVTHAWAKRAHGLFEWLESVGVDLGYQRMSEAEHPEFPCADAVEVRRQGLLKDGTPIDDRATAGQAAAGFAERPQRNAAELRTGAELWTALADAVTRRGVPVLWESPADRLMLRDGRVVGVEFFQHGDRRQVLARKGVVLATGGYEFDEDAKQHSLKAPMHFYGNPGSTGDGLRMAQEIGASLWHMNMAVGRGIGHFPDGDGGWLNFPLHLEPGGYVITDRQGRRFANEFAQASMSHAFYNELIHFDLSVGGYSRIPAYWFFDSRRMDAGSLTSPVAGLVGVGLYDWSADNSRELDRGWISRGATILEAARACGLASPEVAAAEIEEYNVSCARGGDRFGRPVHSLVPLDSPPFYCVELYPGGSNTSGGPRRDERARVLDVRGRPIPGLFGAGELGQVIGMLYPAAGCNLCEAFCFGRIAAEEAIEGAQ